MRPIRKLQQAPLAERARYPAVVFFLVVVAFMGGASRSDVSSLPLLRGFSVLLAAFVIWTLTAAQWRLIRTPLLLLLVLAGWMAIQLVPLPPALWMALPQRDLIAEADALIGLGAIWRPISLTPSMTWNSLLSLTVPFAALLLFASLDRTELERLILVFLAVAGASILFGLLQLAGGPDSAFYLYRITNNGMMTGLFSNRNHFAVFLAIAIVFARLAVLNHPPSATWRAVRPWVLTLFVGAATLSILANGSRAGVGLGALALGYGWYSLATVAPRSGQGMVFTHLRDGWLRGALTWVPPLALTLIGASVHFAGGSFLALERAQATIIADDSRVQAAPTVLEMLSHHWGVGSGFGSFAAAYRIVEPDALLQPSYLNHAHIDWLQWSIEGGTPAIIIGVIFFVWLSRQFSVKGARSMLASGDMRLGLCFIFLLFALSSLVDYPLRTPWMQVVAIWALVTVCQIRVGLAGHDVERVTPPMSRQSLESEA